MPHVQPSWRGRAAVLALLALGIVATRRGVQAEESQNIITVQARITQAGAPLDASLALTFEVYDQATAGTLLWGPEAQTVTVRNGILSARLGDVTALGDVFKPGFHTTTERWVAIKRDGGAEIVPRVRLTAVPYAQGATRAATAVVASAIWTSGGELTISGLDLRYLEAADVGEGLEVDAGTGKLKLVSTSGGAGLTYTAGVLAVGQGTAISVGADIVSVNTSALVSGGAAPLDGDALVVDYAPGNYSAGSTMLVAHLAGIDAALVGGGGGGSGGDATATSAGGRLSASSSAPVPTSDITATSSIYYLPYVHSRISLWDGDGWVVRDLGSGVSLVLSSLSTSPAKNYDVFASWDAGVYPSGAVILELGTTWSSDTARASGTGGLSQLHGVHVKGATGSQVPSRRYVGTIRSVSATETCSSSVLRFVYSHDNRVLVVSTSHDNASWTYGSATWRNMNNGVAAWRHEAVFGLPGSMTMGLTVMMYAASVGGGEVNSGIGVDQTSPSVYLRMPYAVTHFSGSVSYGAQFDSGYHFMQGAESYGGGGGGTGAWSSAGGGVVSASLR